MDLLFVVVIIPLVGMFVYITFVFFRAVLDPATNRELDENSSRRDKREREAREEAAAAVARDADRRRHEKDLEGLRRKVCRVWRGLHPNEGPVELLFESDGLVVFNFRGGQVAKSGHYEILASPKGYLLRFIIPKEDIEEEVGLRLLSNGQLILDFGQFELLLTPV